MQQLSGSKIADALENNSFTISSMHLKLRKECKKKDFMKVGESKGLDYKIVKLTKKKKTPKQKG